MALPDKRGRPTREIRRRLALVVARPGHGIHGSRRTLVFMLRSAVTCFLIHSLPTFDSCFGRSRQGKFASLRCNRSPCEERNRFPRYQVGNSFKLARSMVTDTSQAGNTSLSVSLWWTKPGGSGRKRKRHWKRCLDAH